LQTLDGASSYDVPLGYTAPLQAVAHFVDGGQVEVTNQAIWSSSDRTILRVSQTGLVSPTSASLTGAATVTATFETLMNFPGSASVQVSVKDQSTIMATRQASLLELTERTDSCDQQAPTVLDRDLEVSVSGAQIILDGGADGRIAYGWLSLGGDFIAHSTDLSEWYQGQFKLTGNGTGSYYRIGADNCVQRASFSFGTVQPAEGILADPCQLVTEAFVGGVLGNPVFATPQVLGGTGLACLWAHFETSTVTEFEAGAIETKAALTLDEVLKFISYKNIDESTVQYVVINDEDGLLDELVAAGTVEADGHVFQIVAGTPDPLLGRLAIMERLGDGSLSSAAAILTWLDGYDLSLSVSVYALEPDDGSIPQFYPVDDYVTRTQMLSHALYQEYLAAQPQ